MNSRARAENDGGFSGGLRGKLREAAPGSRSDFWEEEKRRERITDSWKERQPPTRDEAEAARVPATYPETVTVKRNAITANFVALIKNWRIAPSV